MSVSANHMSDDCNGASTDTASPTSTSQQKVSLNMAENTDNHSNNPLPASEESCLSDSSDQAKGGSFLESPKCYDVKNFLELFHTPGSVFELRALYQRDDGSKGVASGYFNDIQAATTGVSQMCGHRPQGIYATLNPLRPDLLARGINTVNHNAKETAKDEDVLERRWLLIDLDPRRPSGISSTDAEMTAALKLGKSIRDALRADGWPMPIMGMSGNGCYLLYKIHLRNDAESNLLIKNVVATLADRFDTVEVEIDRKVFNASRLCKVLGTFVQKGHNLVGVPGVEDRPHRDSFFFVPSGQIVEVDRRLLEDLVAKSEVAEPPTDPQQSSAPQTSNFDAGRLSRCWNYLKKLDDAISGQNGSGKTFRACCIIYKFGCSEQEALTLMNRFNDEKTGGEPWSERELHRKLADAKRTVEEEGTFGSMATCEAAGISDPCEFIPFPVAVLPSALREYVSQASESAQSDSSYIALTLFASLGGLIGNTRELLLKGTYSVRTCFWVACIGDSGCGKSPAIRLVTRPILARLKDLRKNKRLKSSDALLQYNNLSWYAPADAPITTFPREVNDITLEALAVILSKNPRGVLLCKHELLGWLASFDQYRPGGRGSDEAHWLSFFDGEPVQFDRKTGRPKHIAIEAPFINVMGGIQPQPFRNAFTEKDNRRQENGLLARLFVTNPPRKPLYWNEAGVDPKLYDTISVLVDKLLALDFAPLTGGTTRKPCVYTLSPQAKTLWHTYYNSIVDERHALEPGVESAFLSKLADKTARLALLFQIVREASEVGLPQDRCVDDISLSKAIEVAKWIKHETFRVYRTLLSKQKEISDTELTALIQGRGGKITVRELSQYSRAFKGKSKEAERALQQLVEAGLGEWKQTPQGRSKEFHLFEAGTSTRDAA